MDSHNKSEGLKFEGVLIRLPNKTRRLQKDLAANAH